MQRQGKTCSETQNPVPSFNSSLFSLSYYFICLFLPGCSHYTPWPQWFSTSLTHNCENRFPMSTYLVKITQLIIQDDPVWLVWLRPGQSDATRRTTHLVHHGNSRWDCNKRGGSQDEREKYEGRGTGGKIYVLAFQTWLLLTVWSQTTWRCKTHVSGLFCNGWLFVLWIYSLVCFNVFN